VSWLERIRHARPEEPKPAETFPVPRPPVERAAPGVAALFAGLGPGEGHSVLDLGPAAESHLRLYCGFARQIRFADLLPHPPKGAALVSALKALPPNPRLPYDLVLAWNLLDRLDLEERSLLIERLAEITAPDARLYIVVDASGEPTTQPLRYTLLDVDRITQRAVGRPEPAQRQLLPAQVERLLAPFEVVHAFTLRLGLREYVAVKGGEDALRAQHRGSAQARRHEALPR